MLESDRGLVPEAKRIAGSFNTISPDALEPFAFHAASVGAAILIGWFERCIIEYGMQTGVTALGLLLLRVADPHFETPTARSFGFKQLLYEPMLVGPDVLSREIYPSRKILIELFLCQPLLSTDWGL